MFEYTCKICGKVFQDEKNQGNVSRALLFHIRKEHNISSTYEYILKVYYNNVIPTCACGCGTEVKWNYKNALFLPRHGFLKYCSCSHIATTRETREKMKQSQLKKWDSEESTKNYIETRIPLDKVKAALEDVKNGLTYGKISEKYNIDYRTLVSYWKHLKLISNEELREYTRYNQYIIPSQQSKKNIENKDQILQLLYEILYSNPGQFNIRSLVRYFNKYHKDLYIHARPEIILEMLFEKYGEEIDTYLSYGLHSREELNFSRILIYYFGARYVKIGKKLKYGSSKKYVYIYDICIHNQIIIEYDGNGFYHNNEETIIRDKEKEDFAIQHGYIFMRISDEAAKDPETIVKIKNLLKLEENKI